jgi:hypothetical protein
MANANNIQEFVLISKGYGLVELKVVQAQSIQMALFRNHLRGDDLLYAAAAVPTVEDITVPQHLVWKKTDEDYHKNVLIIKEDPHNAGVSVENKAYYDEVNLIAIAINAMKDGCKHVLVSFPETATFSTGWAGSCYYCGGDTVGNYFE